MKTSFRSAGFTLVEVLVVIAITALLAGLIFPAITKGLNTAKQNTAMTEARTLAGAIEMFYKDYGYLPVPAEDQGLPKGTPDTFNFDVEDSKKIIQVLVADPQNYNEKHQLNPRKKNYLDADVAIVDGEMLDPWGSQYVIKLDRDYDGKVAVDSSDPKYNTRAVVVSPGRDQELNTPEDNVANVLLDTDT